MALETPYLSCTPARPLVTTTPVVIDHHLGPAELAAVFTRSVLNVHPCPYDAYGMTAAASNVLSAGFPGVTTSTCGEGPPETGDGGLSKARLS